MSEIEETERLLAIATFPALRNLLSKHLAQIQSEAMAVDEVKGVVVDTALASEESLPKTEQKKAAPPVESKREERPQRPVFVGGSYIPIDNFAWDNGGYNSSTLTIFIDLPNVGTVKQNVAVNFTKNSFELTVIDLGGKNYKLVKENLEKDIVPEQSKFVVKKDKILVKLQKIKGEYSFDTWNNLTAKKKRDPEAEARRKADPSGGLMDMMKDMYEDGDENMRKVIGESMLKSQRGEKSAPPTPGDFP